MPSVLEPEGGRPGCRSLPAPVGLSVCSSVCPPVSLSARAPVAAELGVVGFEEIPHWE